MAVAPATVLSVDKRIENGLSSEKEESESESEDDSDSEEESHDRLLAAACDDGSVRLYRISDLNKLTYYRSLPRVSGMNFSTLIMIISIPKFFFLVYLGLIYLPRSCLECYMES